MQKLKDEFSRKWIIDNGVPIVKTYGGELTLRALHYRLVAIGMTNSQLHYKRVIGAMTKARWDGLLQFNDFIDHERDVVGFTAAEETVLNDEIEYGKSQITEWMNYYKKNRWENQETYIEVFIEKKALQSVFQHPCRDMSVALCPCKGYPSLTYLYRAYHRFVDAMGRGQRPLILYFGDYDPSGEDIPRSLQEVIGKMGIHVDLERMALLESQVIEWNLPPAPTKVTDTRSVNWDGIGQVELDAVEPRQLQEMAADSIKTYFDEDLWESLQAVEQEEKDVYQNELKQFVESL